jgi:hypothetical protein
MKWLFSLHYSLFDVAATFFAVVGIVFVFVADSVNKLKNWQKWAISILMIVFGIAASVSSAHEHSSSDKAQEKLQKEVDSYGPVLQQIMANSQSPKQVAQAINLHEKLAYDKPKIDQTRALLNESTAWQKQLCGFAEKWYADERNKKAIVEGSAYDPNDLTMTRTPELRFAIQNLDADETEVYLRDYAPTSNSLRIRMIGEIPLAANPYIDYLKPKQFTSTIGREYINAHDMHDLCEDFQNMVTQLDSKIQTGNYKRSEFLRY